MGNPLTSLHKFTPKLTISKETLEQQDFGVIHKEVNANLKNLQTALYKDKQVKFQVLESYMSEYDVVDELLKIVDTHTFNIMTFLQETTVAGQTTELQKKRNILVYSKEPQIYETVKDFIGKRKAGEFTPPLEDSWGKEKDIYPYPYKLENDPRRTARIVQLEPKTTITDNKDWFKNNSILYGFLIYGNVPKLSLAYIGLEVIKKIPVTDENLPDIVHKFTTLDGGTNILDYFNDTPLTITANKVKTFSLPSSAVVITTHNATLNDGQTRPNLVVVDGQPILNTTATAFLKMQAAAKADGVNIVLSSGFRPALGIGVQGTTVDGKVIKMTTQEELRRDSKRWVKTHPDWAKYPVIDDFVMKAASSAFNPATAPPKASQHGTGIAVDVNTGGRNNFQPLNNVVYKWMIQNSWKFGFIRTVSTEEWHYEYQPSVAIKGPYARVGGSNANKFYTDLSLDIIRIT